MRREGESEEGLTTNSGPDSTSPAMLVSQYTERFLQSNNFFWSADSVTNVGSWHTHSSTTERQGNINHHTRAEHTALMPSAHTEYGLDAISTHRVRP